MLWKNVVDSKFNDQFSRVAGLFHKHRLREFFFSAPETKSPKELRVMLSRLILVRVVLLSMLLVNSSWSVLSNGPLEKGGMGVFWAFGTIYTVSLLNALLLRSTSWIRTVGYLQLLLDVLLATAAIFITNSAISIFLYLLVIVGAALIFSRHGAVIIAAFSGLCYGALASGLLQDSFSSTFTAGTDDILLVYSSFVLVAIVSGYLARQLEIMNFIADTNARHLDLLNKQQRQLFNDISEGIITLDLAATITGINEAARTIMGLGTIDAEHFVGKPLKSVINQHGILGLDTLIHGKHYTENPCEVTIQGRDPGQDIHLSYSIKPLLDSEGSQIGKILIFDDVSHVKGIEERLKLHERMTKLLSETAEQIQGGRFAARDVKMVGESPVMHKVFSLVERVSKSDASLLITGESGTGKELIARAVHAQGARAQKPFVAINCGAIPENLLESELFGHKKGAFTGAINDNPGLFRQANGGTIFLDEIGELPLHLQTKLLRALQDKIIRSVGDNRDTVLDVRIIAATNRDLKKQILEGKFREDLFYRLNVVNIFVPPLRDRTEDIPLLVQHFLAKYCGSDRPLPQISPDALRLLISYPFPGNVRELENVIERSLVLGGAAILPEHLPEEVVLCGLASQNPPRQLPAAETPQETEIVMLPVDLEAELSRLERGYLVKALTQTGGAKKRAAELLGLNFRSFRYRVKKYGLAENDGGLSDDNT